MALIGRKIRWAYSSDDGATYTNFAGSVNDSITFGFTYANSTSKDDNGAQDFVDDLAGSNVAGAAELHFVNTALMDAVLDNPSTYRHYMRLTVEGQYTATGRFVITEIGDAGAEGDETLKQSISIASAGGVTYARVT